LSLVCDTIEFIAGGLVILGDAPKGPCSAAAAAMLRRLGRVQA